MLEIARNPTQRRGVFLDSDSATFILTNMLVYVYWYCIRRTTYAYEYSTIFRLHRAPRAPTVGFPSTSICAKRTKQWQLSTLYKNKSVAEQNSLDTAWAVLMSKEFKELRAILFATRADLLRYSVH